jgi:hypothetical protein
MISSKKVSGFEHTIILHARRAVLFPAQWTAKNLTVVGSVRYTVWRGMGQRSNVTRSVRPSVPRSVRSS